MDYTDIQPLLNTFHRKLAATDLKFKRYLHGQINWDVRLLGIKGARGVGKTTMLLQHIKETAGNLDEVFYVSMDNMWFQTHSILELVEFYIPVELRASTLTKFTNTQTGPYSSKIYMTTTRTCILSTLVRQCWP